MNSLTIAVALALAAPPAHAGTCYSDLTQDLNCNNVDVLDEPATSDAKCKYDSADWYYDYAAYGCAYSVADLDTDGDGLSVGSLTLMGEDGLPNLTVELSCDNCPDMPNVDQSDVDCDDRGDLCDNCHSENKTAQTEPDLDELGEV